MQEKIKMTWQEEKHLGHGQQQNSTHLLIKLILKS